MCQTFYLCQPLNLMLPSRNKFFFLLPSEFEYCLPQLAWEKGFYVVVQNSNTANTLWRRGIYLNVITLKIYAQ
jgi:hypothetical protein